MSRYFVHPAIAVGACLVVPVERVDVEQGRSGRARWFSAGRGIHALVIRDSHGLRALDAEGESLPLEDLDQLVPGLIRSVPTLRGEKL